MISKGLKPISWALAVGLVLLLATTTGGAFVHEVQHAHHNAAMHTTGICAWMCATAGAVIAPLFLPVTFAVVQPSVLPLERQLVSLIFASRLQARAPPTLL
jgi:hypothetical protein